MIIKKASSYFYYHKQSERRRMFSHTSDLNQNLRSFIRTLSQEILFCSLMFLLENLPKKGSCKLSAQIWARGGGGAKQFRNTDEWIMISIFLYLKRYNFTRLNQVQMVLKLPTCSNKGNKNCIVWRLFDASGSI